MTTFKCETQPNRSVNHFDDQGDLIAAAPEMLEYLKYIRVLHDLGFLGNADALRRHSLDTIIAKAEGRE